jgi:hypothetical protein
MRVRIKKYYPVCSTNGTSFHFVFPSTLFAFVTILSSYLSSDSTDFSHP